MNATEHRTASSTHRIHRTHRSHRIQRIRRACGAVAATATFIVAVSAMPAAARQDPGQINPPTSSTGVHFCTPERVGTQYVACDNQTGNGVPAPSWVHER
jgi:hypothetical protein